MGEANEKWIRMSFKGNKIWVHTGEDGDLVQKNGKVRVKYNLKQDYEYTVKVENLRPESEAVPSQKGKGKSTPSKEVARNAALVDDAPENSIKIFTDGASSGNPGPAGIGVLLIYKDKEKRISKYIGRATNNVAELTAIQEGLAALKRKDLPVRIYSDSTYAIGLLTQEWKPKTNQKLVHGIRALADSFSDLSFIKVKGHAGIRENEVADTLATSAIKKKA